MVQAGRLPSNALAHARCAYIEPVKGAVANNKGRRRQHHLEGSSDSLGNATKGRTSLSQAVKIKCPTGLLSHRRLS